MNYELWHCDLKIVSERPSKFWKKYSTYYVITKFFFFKERPYELDWRLWRDAQNFQQPSWLLRAYSKRSARICQNERLLIERCVVGCPWTCVYIYVYIQTELFSVSHPRDCYRKGLLDFFKFYIWLVRITWEPSKSVIIIIIIPWPLLYYKPDPNSYFTKLFMVKEIFLEIGSNL